MSRYGKRIQFVTVYETGRNYGGPQEGGWYYDTGTVVACFPVLRHRAERLLERVKDRCDRINREERRRCPSSVLSRGDYLVAWLEDRPGEDYPRERPGYE